MRVPFHQIFSENANGSISPRTAVNIGGVTMGPGVAFTRGVSFSGVDIASMAGRELEVEYQGQLVVITGVY